jgi:NAD(P)-dependent dehydrogenase (short-subunit alcohol dehydrogenase family)
VEQLESRVAVVTGAASGLGRALASELAAAGCRLVLADVEESALADCAEHLRRLGADCLPIVTDVADAGSVLALAHATIERFGAVHVLCNSAGVSARRPVTGMALEDWKWVIDVDLWGVIHGVHHFLPILLEQDEAHIVNVASMAGLLAFPMGAPYNAAKAAVVSLSETVPGTDPAGRPGRSHRGLSGRLADPLPRERTEPASCSAAPPSSGSADNARIRRDQQPVAGAHRKGRHAAPRSGGTGRQRGGDGGVLRPHP